MRRRAANPAIFNIQTNKQGDTVMDEAKRDLRSIWSFMDKLAFTQGYVDVNGVQTRFVNAGPKDAPVVVMIHGMGGSWENFTANFPVFAQHFNTYAYDLKGHGYSGKPDEVHDVGSHVTHLEGFTKALGLTKFSIFGLSIGGWVGTKFTIRNPDLVDKLIVMSAWGRVGEDQRVMIAVVGEEWQAIVGDIIREKPRRGHLPDFNHVGHVETKQATVEIEARLHRLHIEAKMAEPPDAEWPSKFDAFNDICHLVFTHVLI
jgi:pimeloyl-ACP methyl ester carboxylesterase